MKRAIPALACAFLFAGCSRPATTPPVTPPVSNVAVAPAEAPLQEGDC